MPLITVRDIANIGRFGNACFVWVFAKAYALHHGCELQVGDWAGRKIFVHAAADPFVAVHDLTQTEMDSQHPERIGHWLGAVDVDVKSYCQHQTFVNYLTRKNLREWLTVKPELEARYATDKVVSAAHLRRGDYLTKYKQWYCTVSDDSYERAINHFNIPRPVVMVQEGWREEPEELKAMDCGFLRDWLLLRDAQYLLRANSSFSLFSAWAGHGKVYAPIVEDKVGLHDCQFVAGNWPVTAGKFRNQSALFLREE